MLHYCRAAARSLKESLLSLFIMAWAILRRNLACPIWSSMHQHQSRLLEAHRGLNRLAVCQSGEQGSGLGQLPEQTLSLC